MLGEGKAQPPHGSASPQSYQAFTDMLDLNDNEFFRPRAVDIPGHHTVAASTEHPVLAGVGTEAHGGAPPEAEARWAGAPTTLGAVPVAVDAEGEDALVEETLERGEDADFFGPVAPRCVVACGAACHVKLCALTS